jgi:5-methylcytosine-specific restriction endonuclease McrA
MALSLALKARIRQRDDYQCLRCGYAGVLIHHLDFNKENNDEERNLVTVCESCYERLWREHRKRCLRKGKPLW